MKYYDEAHPLHPFDRVRMIEGKHLDEALEEVEKSLAQDHEPPDRVVLGQAAWSCLKPVKDWGDNAFTTKELGAFEWFGRLMVESKELIATELLALNAEIQRRSNRIINLHELLSVRLELLRLEAERREETVADLEELETLMYDEDFDSDDAVRIIRRMKKANGDTP